MEFTVCNLDSPTMKRAKLEFNALLRHYPKINVDIIKLLFNIIDCIEETDIPLEYYTIISKYLDNIINNKTIAPLFLEDNEFDTDGLNIRCSSVFKKDGKIYYFDAFDYHVVHVYNDIDKKEVELDNKSNKRFAGGNVYINAGGVFTGQYFNLASIRKEVVDAHCYTPREAIHIPISIIELPNGHYFTMDKREPKFKALCEFYDVEIKYDEKMKSKFDIRKYEKLSKKTSRKERSKTTE